MKAGTAAAWWIEGHGFVVVVVTIFSLTNAFFRFSFEIAEVLVKIKHIFIKVCPSLTQ